MSSLIEATKLLLHLNGDDGDTSTSDSSIYKHNIIFNGSSSLDADITKFGLSSVLLPGSSYLTIPDSSQFDFGTGNFTVEFWLYMNSNVGDNYFIGWTSSDHSDGHFAINLLGSDWRVGGFSNHWIQVGSSITLETWNHIALVRNGNILTFYENGIGIASRDITGVNFNCTGNLYVGKIGDSRLITCNANIDELRISNVAEYTANFTPQSSEYALGNLLDINLELDFNNGFYVSNDLRLDYDVFQVVYQTYQMLFDIGFTLYKDFQFLLTSSSWIIKDSQFSFFINSEILKSLDILFNQGSLVNKDIEVIQSSQSYILNDLQVLLNQGIHVSNDIAFLLNSRSYVLKDTNLNFYIGELIDKDLESRFNMSGRIYKDLKCDFQGRWDVYRQFRTLDNSLQYVIKDLNVLFTIFQTVYQDLNILFKSYQSVIKDLNVIFTFLDVIYKDINFLYNVSSTILSTSSVKNLNLSLDKIKILTLSLENKLKVLSLQLPEAQNVELYRIERKLSIIKPQIKKINIVR